MLVETNINFPELKDYQLDAVDGENADYKTEKGFGFYNMITIRTMYLKDKPDKKIVRVRHLACNSYGKGSCLVCVEDWFTSITDALNNLQGVKVKPKPPKRKLIVQPPATVEELNDYLGIEVFVMND